MYSARVSLLNNELFQFLLTLIHSVWCFEELKQSFLMTPKNSVCLIHTDHRRNLVVGYAFSRSKLLPHILLSGKTQFFR